MFDCWQTSSPITPFCPSFPHLGKLIREPGCSLLGTCGKLKLFKPLQTEFRSVLPCNCNKSQSRLPFPTFSNHFQSSLRAHPALPRKPYMWIISHTFLVSVWYHQFWHWNLIFHGSASSHLCRATIKYFNIWIHV